MGHVVGPPVVNYLVKANSITCCVMLTMVAQLNHNRYMFV